MKIRDWIILALTLVIIVLILTRPTAHDDNKAAYLDSLRFLKAKERDIRLQETRIIQTSKDRAKSDSLKLAHQESKIQALQNRSVKTRVVVQHVIDTIPALKVFVAQQDSIITEQHEVIDTLKASVIFQRKLFVDLVLNHEAERDISKRIESEQDKRIASLEKQVKRTKRGNRWLKAGIIGAAVGGLFLSSHL